MLDKELNGQRSGARKPKSVDEWTEPRGLKSNSMVDKEDREGSKRKQKTESKRESLCTLLDLRISSKSLLCLSLLC